MNKFETARIVWPILVDAAIRRKKITYGEIAKSLGYRGATPVRYPLWAIQDYCLDNQLPPLTILVINEITKFPGEGFIAWPRPALEDGYRRVFDFDWGVEIRPFDPDAVAAVPKKRPSLETQYEVKDSWVKSMGRGPYQTKFRDFLLEAYGHRCALCDTALSELLIAAHIVPWSIDEHNRLNPKNGILLCKTHDALFEHGYISIDTMLQVTLAKNVFYGRDAKDFIVKSTQDMMRRPSAWANPDVRFLQWRLDYHSSCENTTFTRKA